METSEENSKRDPNEKRVDSYVPGLSLSLVLALASLLTLFGFALLESIAGFQFGAARLLVLAGILVVLNVCFMVLVGRAISGVNDR